MDWEDISQKQEERERARERERWRERWRERERARERGVVPSMLPMPTTREAIRSKNGSFTWKNHRNIDI